MSTSSIIVAWETFLNAVHSDMFSFSDIGGGLLFMPIRDAAIFQWKNVIMLLKL